MATSKLEAAVARTDMRQILWFALIVAIGGVVLCLWWWRFAITVVVLAALIAANAFPCRSRLRTAELQRDDADQHCGVLESELADRVRLRAARRERLSSRVG